MKKIYKNAMIAGVSALSLFSAKAQVATLYSFSQSSATYSAITGGTVFGTTTSDDQSWTDSNNPTTSSATGPGIPIGFAFMYNNIVFDRIAVQNNGWITFGTSAAIPAVNINGGYNGVSNGSSGPLSNGVAGLSRDIQAQGGSSLRVETIGTVPTRTCVIQWGNYRKYGSGNTLDTLNFQIRLCETTNIVEVMYGKFKNNTTSGTAEVGLRGSTNSDYNNRTVDNTNPWAASIAGTANTSIVNFNNTLVPTSGQLYRWSPPQCSGQLQSLAATGNYTMICPGGNVNISLINSYTVSGIVYDWFDATQSQFGPFFSIPGSGGAAYNAMNVTVPTWYQVVATCLNGSSTATSTAFGVAIAPTTTNTVPYYESFESIITNNDLPNCSWDASNTPYVTQTYTSTMTQNRSARTGTRYAAFYSSYTSGSNYFYSNGIEMHPGITYSASLWYKTEFNGYTNVTDLSILYGTTQTTTGLVPIVSTNGPASSGLYKGLGNTFTVPSSGLYYLAIKATGNGNYGVNYLSWDDLEVIIPCNGTVNSPTVSVSASSQTICSGEQVDLTASGADSYVWSNGATGAMISETPNSSTMYSVIGTNALTGCTVNVSSQVVTVNASPSVYAYATNPIICAGTPVNLVAGGTADSYSWTAGTNPNANVITVTPAATTQYTVTGTNNTNACTAMAVIQVSVNNNPTVTASSDATGNEICKGEMVTLSGSGATTYAWAANSIYIQSQQASVMPQGTTTYSLTGTNQNGCVGTTTITLKVNECVGINEITKTLTGVSVYPNPASNVFTVELNNNSLKTIQVTDLTGRVVLTTSSNDVKVNVNVNALANGIYYVKIQSDNAVEVIKVVKN